MSDLRSKILSAKDRREQVVEIPEWGVSVLVRSMTAGDRGELMDAVREKDGTMRVGEMHTRVALLTAHDPETKRPIFEPLDIDALAGKHPGAIDRIATLGLELSGMGADVKAALEKNSDAAGDGSSSDSPVN